MSERKPSKAEKKALRERELRERALDKQYKTEAGYELPKQRRKQIREEEVKALHEDRKQRKEKQGQRWRYRRNAKRDQARVRAARKALDKGNKPRIDDLSFIGGRKGRLARVVYRFVGLESQPLIEDLIRSYYEDKTARVTISIGTGYGKGATWIGSRTFDPHRAYLWLQGWENLPSAQEVLQHAEEGGAIWWEIEVLTFAFKASEYVGLTKKRKKHK